MNGTTLPETGPRVHVAETVLPGHPDRLADGLADALVAEALKIDTKALVGVEVAVHRDVAFVTGRIAAGAAHPPRFDLEAIAARVYREAGYEGRWALAPRVVADLDTGKLSDDEREVRDVSDDQNICVGHAEFGEATGWYPPAVWACARLREALFALRGEHADVLGPDGKLLVRMEEDDRGRFSLERLNVAIQHVEGLPYAELFGLVGPAMERVVREVLDPVLPDLAASWSEEVLRVNGAGDFSCGGPWGDNGLSGKKLVVDAYGPGVPIGGGATCGKDPHKVDVRGARRAREMAVEVAREKGARSVTVWMGWLPGLREPDWVRVEIR